MKTKAVFVTIFILIILVMTWQANIAKSQVITDGLVSYWTLNKADIDGETAMDVFGENDGTLIGSPKIVQGKFGEGVEFDGSDDYCELPQILLGDFTIEAWFSALSAPGTWSRVFDAGLGGAGDAFITPNHGRTGNDIGYTIHYSGGGRAEFGSDVKVNVGDWYHVAATFDKGGEGMKLYVNGELKGDDAYNKESFEDWNTPQNWYLAKSNWGDPLFPGIIDEVRIYSRALSDDEINQNMNVAGLAVENPTDKLAEIWGGIKVSR